MGPQWTSTYGGISGYGLGSVVTGSGQWLQGPGEALLVWSQISNISPESLITRLAEVSFNTRLAEPHKTVD